MATNSELDKYIQGGTKLSSSIDTFNKSVSQKNKSNWLSGLSGLINKGAGLISQLEGTLSGFSKKASLDGLLKSLGLNDSALFKTISSRLGLKSGLFDTWASDLVNSGMAFINTGLADIGNGLLQGLASKLSNLSVMDNTILNSVVKPLRYTGANPNYKNTLLKACLESDLPQCLAYLDGYNNTEYNHNNNMWKRGTYAARHGCWKVSKYILEILDKGLKKYGNGTQTDDEDLIFWYKSRMIEIFRATVIYSYSNFDEACFNELIKVNNDLLGNYSYYGDNDITFNNKYRFTPSEIDTMAPIVKMTDYGNDDNKSSFVAGWQDPGAGTNIDISRITHTVDYIDPRNGNIKILYVLMANNVTSDTARLVNKELHDRLKISMLNLWAKMNSNMLNAALNSKTYKDLVYLLDTENGVVLASQIHAALTALQDTHVLRTMDDIYRERTTANSFDVEKWESKDKDIGDFNPYVKPSSGDPTSTTTTTTTTTNPSSTTTDPSVPTPGKGTDTSETPKEQQEHVNERVEDNTVDNDFFKAIGSTHADFKILDVTDMNASQRASAISSIMAGGSYELVDTKTLNKMNNVDVEYNELHTFMIYCKNKAGYESATSEIKDGIFKQLVAISLVKNYVHIYSVDYLKLWYGETKRTPVYDKDDKGNIIYDPSNNTPIIRTYTKTHTQDADIAKYLEQYRVVANELARYFRDLHKNEKFKITFDNQRIGNTPNALTDITPFSVLTTDLPRLTDGGNKFVFIGWTTVPGDKSTLFNRSNTLIARDLTLYALWTEAATYIVSAKLLKADNSTLDEDIYATVDHTSKTVFFPIKEKEQTSGAYIINIEVSEGSTSSINMGEKVYLTADGIQTATITDIYGNKTIYTLKSVSVPDNAKRVCYINREAKIVGLRDGLLYVNPEQSISLSEVSVTRTGFTGSGWTIMSDGTSVITSIEYDTANSFTLVYPKLTETEYIVTYNDKNGVPFSGTHSASYVTKFTYRDGAILDTPTKNGYVFLGYFTDPSCSESTKLTNIPRFFKNENFTIYADWIDSATHEAQTGNVLVNGVAIDLSKLTFYTRYIVSGGLQWAVTTTGLAKYTAIGDLINRVSLDNNNTPLGITYDAETDMFLCVAKTNSGKLNLFYSVDDGIKWTFATEVTGFRFIFFAGTGLQTLEFLMYYTTMVYQGIVFTLENNKICANGTPVIDGDNVPILEGKTISGFSITIDGSFYLLIVGFGVLRLTFDDFDFEMVPDPDAEPGSTDTTVTRPGAENVKSENVQPWDPNKDPPSVDNTSVGSPYNNIKADASGSKLNDDFDIDDPEIINNILKNAQDKSVSIRAFRNASILKYNIASDGKYVPVYGPNDINNWVWEENPEALNRDEQPPVLWLINYQNKGKYIPSINNPLELVTLNRKETPIVKEVIVKAGNLLEYHKELITKDNYRNYIGWNKKDDSNPRGKILTSSYMNSYWNIADKKPEEWEIKIDKQEMVEDEHGVYHKRFFTSGSADDHDPNVNKFYIDPEGTQDFKDYKSENHGSSTSEYYKMIESEQKNIADSYKGKYLVTQNANGSERYDGITKDFYKYITGGFKEDVDVQTKIFENKNERIGG